MDKRNMLLKVIALLPLIPIELRGTWRRVDTVFNTDTDLDPMALNCLDFRQILSLRTTLMVMVYLRC